MAESPVEERMLDSVVSALKEYYKGLGASVNDGEGYLDFIVENSVGITRVRIGFIAARSGDPFSYLGRAYAAWKDGIVDKVVVIVPDNVVVRKTLSRYGFVEAVATSELETFLAGMKTPVDESAHHMYLEPDLTVEEVRQLAEKHRGWIIKKGDFLGALLVYIQLYCFDVDWHAIDYVSEVLEHTTATLCFDSVTGSVVYFDEGLRVSGDWQGLAQLSEEAIMVLKRVSELGEASIAELREELGGEIGVDSIVEVLVGKRLLEPSGVDIFTLSEPPLNASGFEQEIMKRFSRNIREGKPECEFMVNPRANIYNIIRILSAYGSVRSRKTIYYPLIVMVYRRQVRDRNIEVTILVDGMTRNRVAEIEELLGESPAVADIDTFIEHIKSGDREVIICRSEQEG